MEVTDVGLMCNLCSCHHFAFFMSLSGDDGCGWRKRLTGDHKMVFSYKYFLKIHYSIFLESCVGHKTRPVHLSYFNSSEAF